MENVLIKNARIDDIKRFEDGTLYIEVYAEERLLSDLPAKNGLNYLNMYVRKDNYLTYNGESYKLIDDENKSITWKDGSTSVYGERKTFFDYIEPFLFGESWEPFSCQLFSSSGEDRKNKKVRKKSP